MKREGFWYSDIPTHTDTHINTHWHSITIVKYKRYYLLNLFFFRSQLFKINKRICWPVHKYKILSLYHVLCLLNKISWIFVHYF